MQIKIGQDPGEMFRLGIGIGFLMVFEPLMEDEQQRKEFIKELASLLFDEKDT